MSKRNQALLIGATTVAIAALLSYWLLTPPSPRFRPSPYAVQAPEADTDFADYVAETRARIRNALRDYYFDAEEPPFFGNYSLAQVTDMRAPFELAPASNCVDAPERLGMLMVHGLSDSPYLLRPLASRLKFRFPCARIRALLTPGHGTVPGDLLAADPDTWRAAIDYGVNSFDHLVDRLILVGYSNGSALGLDYLNRHPQQNKLDRLILISPGLQSSNEQAWLAPWIWPVWPWINELPDTDAAKYESFPTTAAAAFYRLTRAVRTATTTVSSLPTLTLVSAEDTTVKSMTSLRYYCQWLENSDSRLLWFGTLDYDLVPPGCQGIELVPLAPDPRFLSYSHVAFTIPPGDSHYGKDGNYPVCLTYLNERERYRQCREDWENTVYGELSLLDEDGTVAGRLLRRSTFNPAFDDMLEELVCFIAGEC